MLQWVHISKVHIRKISQLDSVSERWEEIHGRKPNEDDVDEMFADFVPLQLACLADYSDLIPGTLEKLAGMVRLKLSHIFGNEV